jgi:hypothetical protein
MKTVFIFLLLFVSTCAFSQKFALLDPELKKPILYTDSITLEQVSQKFIPFQVSSFDTIYSHLKYLTGVLSEDVKRSKMKSFELRSGLTVIKLTSVSHAYGDSYDIDFITKANNITSNFKFGKNESLNKGNVKKLKKLMEYMKNATSLFQPGYVELSPTLYEVVVYQ